MLVVDLEDEASLLLGSHEIVADTGGLTGRGDDQYVV